MKLFLRSKLAALVLVITLVSLITGVALAANSSSPRHQELNSSIIGLEAIPVEVPVGGALKVVGAGFTPEELVLVEIYVGGGVDTIIVDGGRANEAGAFLASIDNLPSSLGAGIYTVKARTIGSPHVASAAVIVCQTSEGKCQ